jgi:lysophospholipase L1-like esterase
MEAMSRVKIGTAGIAIVLFCALFAGSCSSPPSAPPATERAAGVAPAAVPAPASAAKSAPAIPHDFARWEKDIAAFEAEDRLHPPKKGGALFTGSSTIRLWKTLAEDFPGHAVTNRGFGGSEIADAAHFADRFIVPHEPRQIFLRAGGNDIHAGRLPEEVAADFAEFVRAVHARLPKTEILYISLAPSPARWGEKDKGATLDWMIRNMALRMPRVAYVDASDISLTPDGKARPELFVEDRLHFSAEGYKLLAERVRPFVWAPVPK